MANLTRKKVRVRTKSGKVYQRSMLVKAETKKLNKGGKLNALNPWEQRHMEHVSTNSALGERARAYGSSGPGSDHSWFAHVVGAYRDRVKYKHEGGVDSFTAQAARARRMSVELSAGPYANSWEASSAHEAINRAHRVNSTHDSELVRAHSANGIWRGHDLERIEHVPQNPRKWVR